MLPRNPPYGSLKPHETTSNDDSPTLLQAHHGDHEIQQSDLEHGSTLSRDLGGWMRNFDKQINASISHKTVETGNVMSLVLW